MKKIKALVVSQLPWSHSNRGIDILTEALSEIKRFEVYHLVFPHNFKFLTRVSEYNPNIKQLYAKRQYLFYYDKLMWWLPKEFIKIIIQYTINSAKNINFKNYDLIVLESGYPVLLQEIIPKEKIIIYRQSDSMKKVLNKNPLLWQYEDKIIERADLIFVIKEYFKKLIPKRYHTKTKVVVNGFNIPTDKIIEKSPYPKNSKNVVYLGYAPIEFQTVISLVKNNPQVNFHIIGRGLNKLEIIKLNKYQNFKHHGILSPKQYLPYIKYSNAIIVPYKRNNLTEYSGLTSKYLLAMYFKKPIISYKVGMLDEFKGLPVHFVNNKDEFNKELRRVLKEEKEVNYDLDFEFFSSEGRKKEYKKHIQELLRKNPKLKNSNKINTKDIKKQLSKYRR